MWISSSDTTSFGLKRIQFFYVARIKNTVISSSKVTVCDLLGCCFIKYLNTGQKRTRCRKMGNIKKKLNFMVLIHK